MDNASLVSVVIPVYNAESTIEKCVNSVLEQTYQNFEIILVEDGSPDSSGAVCDALAQKDPRIRVIHKPNGGVSTARNRGIEEASGTFLIFIDSDDWIEENHIESLLPIEDEDLVYGGVRYFVNGIFQREGKIPARVACASEWKRSFLEFGIGPYAVFFITPLYKLGVIRQFHLRFNEELGICEDGLFNLEYIKHIEKIRYAEECTYCYEDGDDTKVSLSRKFHDNRMQAEYLEIKTIEQITDKPEFALRFHHWGAILNHAFKWKRIGSKDIRKRAIQLEKACYQNPYFRECIPWVRQNGSLDQKFETYFMRYWLHPLYKPLYSLIAGASTLKNKLTRSA